MTRWYVTCTWEDWPEGGSYGDIVEAETSEEAETELIAQMAECRAHEMDDDAEYYMEAYANDWHIVDAWHLDDFIKNHTKTLPETD